MNLTNPIVVKIDGAEKFVRLLGGPPATAGMKSGFVTLKPGESVGAHKTEGREEAIVILSGRASIFCRGELFAVAEAASLAYIPPETAHDIKNAGDCDLRYVYVVAPVPAAGRP